MAPKTSASLDERFSHFRRSADPAALAAVFDLTAAELGRVAVHLAGGDRERAADLLQATWLSAMTHAERWDPARPLLPWLLGVLANHARSERRLRRRYAPGADVLGGLLASDDPLRAATDGELATVLAAAIGRLPPPFREVVALHVQHGLSAKQIAAALGRPAGTVRTQVVRGLDRLRQSLPAGLATAGVLVAALGAAELLRVRAHVLARVPRPPLPAARVWPWAVALGAAALAIGLAPWRAAVPSLAPAPVVQVARAAAAAGAASTPSPAREPAAPAPVPALATAPPAQLRIVVRVRHEAAPAAVAGEWVGLVGDEGEVRFAVTDAAGDATFDDVAPAREHQVFVSCTTAQRSIAARERGRAGTWEVTLPVATATDLVVRVVDTAGRPVGGAEVESNGSQFGARTWGPLGTTDANGELRRRDVRSAQLRARAVGHGVSGFANAVADDRPAGLRCQLVLTSPAPELRGRVVDEHGRAVAAELGTVAFGSDLHEPWYDCTDAAGRFAFAWLAAGHVAVVARVRDRGGDRHGLVRVDLPARGDVEIRLQRGAVLAASTKRAGGMAGGGATIRGRLLADAVHALPFATFVTGSVGTGELTRGGLLPGRWLLEARIGETEVREVIELVDGRTTTWRAEAPPLRDLIVRLRDEAGGPLAGWQVQPCNERGSASGLACRTDAAGIARRTGGWWFPADAPLSIAVFDPAGWARSPEFPVLRAPGVLPVGEVMDIVVPATCRTSRMVRGRVVGTDGRPRTATVRVAAPPELWSGVAVASDPDGVFALGPLPPGRVRVVVTAADCAPVQLDATDVPATSDCDLGTVEVAPAVMVCALPAAGPAPRELRVALVGARGSPIGLRRGEDGAFAAAVAPGRYELVGTSATHRVVARTVDVAADAPTELRFACEVAPVLAVVVELTRDEHRAQPEWRGTLRVRDGTGALVAERELRRQFAGHFTASLPFALALAPGAYTLELTTWDERVVRAAVVVGERGGAATLWP